MKVAVLFSSIAIASGLSFSDLGEEIHTLLDDASLQKITTPLLSHLGLSNFSLASIPGKIFEAIGSLDNSVVAFHSIVNANGGPAAFQNAGNMITYAYLAGLIGHMNPENVESASMVELTNAAQTIFNQSVQICYGDLYDIMHNDIVLGLTSDVETIVDSVATIVADIKDLCTEFKDLFGGRRRVLLEHMESLSEAVLFALQTHQEQQAKGLSSFLCDLQPILAKIYDILDFLSDSTVASDISDLQKLLNDLPADNKIVAVISSAVNFTSNILSKYDPEMQNTFLPWLNTIDTFLKGKCSSGRLLEGSNMEFESFDIFAFLTNILDELEKGVQFLNHLPEPLTNDVLQVIYDIIALFAPDKVQYAKAAVSDISGITNGLGALVPAVNATVNDLEALVNDTETFIGHLKALITDIVAFVKELIPF